jgi:hypothetical protein
MHTFQDKAYVILIMYNYSNAITYFKCKAKFIYNFKIKLYLCILKSWTFYKQGNIFNSSFNFILKIIWFFT